MPKVYGSTPPRICPSPISVKAGNKSHSDASRDQRSHGARQAHAPVIVAAGPMARISSRFSAGSNGAVRIETIPPDNSSTAARRPTTCRVNETATPLAMTPLDASVLLQGLYRPGTGRTEGGGRAKGPPADGRGGGECGRFPLDGLDPDGDV